MASPRLHSIRHAAAVTLSVFLASCAVSPGRDSSPVVSVSRAEQLQAMGSFSEAAMLWQEAAVVSTGPERHVYHLQAAEAWMLSGDKSQTALQLRQVDNNQLAAAFLARYALLNAELALESADTEGAEFYLDIARSRISINQQARYQLLVDRIARLRTDPASFAISTAEAALRSMQTYDPAAGVAILQLLEDVPTQALSAYAVSAGTDNQLAEWARLTVVLRRALVAGGSLDAVAAEWAVAHPDHEVTQTGFLDLAGRYQQLYSLPSRIAVLLPETGSLGAAGQAVRDGLISAYLDRPKNVTLTFYPTEEDPQSAVSLYFQAMQEGAQWVVGPLKKDAVNALVALGSLGVPVLLLNSYDNPDPELRESNLLFSISLTQESEASAIAEQALENGWKRALSVSSDDSWGQRMAAEFAEKFASGGGHVTAASQFSTLENDHSAMLTALLKIDESKERGARVQATLGIALNFEPSRRDDFDLIFLAANPTQGRQIRPQLRFHDAGDKPVMAMGRIFTGQTDRNADQDLNGVIFPSTRLHLANSGPAYPEGLSSLRGGSFVPLYALGSDTWNLLPWLPLMRKDPDLYFEGALGSLYVGSGGQILRRPAWAQFSGGRPTPVTWTDLQD